MAHLPTDDGQSLHYRTIGTGPRALVLLHGWMMSSSAYEPLLAALGPDGLAGYTMYVPDLRGAGASSTGATDYSIDRLGRDVIGLAGHLGLARFVLVGHSAAGQLAQWVSAVYPDRVIGQALLCPVPGAGLPLPPDAAGLFRTSGGDRGKQGTILDLACKQLAPVAREALLDVAAGVSEGAVQGWYDAWTAGGFADRLGATQARTLVVATDDPFLPPAFLRAAVVDLIPGARLAYLPGPGHYPQAERPAETAALLEAFVAGLP